MVSQWCFLLILINYSFQTEIQPTSKLDDDRLLEAFDQIPLLYQESNDLRTAYDIKKGNCDQNLPNLNVGDLNITDLEKFKSENEVFILGVSDIQCATCCKIETFLDQIWDSFRNNDYTYKNQTIKLARLDMFGNPRLTNTEKELFKNSPKILVYKKGQFYPYESYLMKGIFINFMNRVLNPTVLLKSEEEISTFLDAEKEFVERNDFFKLNFEGNGLYYQVMSKKTRAIAFFHDKKEYKEEFKRFQEVAQILSKRDDLRIGYVTNKTLVKIYKDKYKQKWFEEFSLNTIVLQREQNVFFRYDIEKDEQDLLYWFNKKSLNNKGEELTQETAVIDKLLNESKGLLFIDRKNKQFKKESIVALNSLSKKVVPEWYNKGVNFFYVEKPQYLEKRKDYGITWDKLPAFVMINKIGQVFPIEERVVIGKENSIYLVLSKHVMEFYKDSLQPYQQIQSKKYEKVIQQQDPDFFDRLSNVKATNKENIKDMINSPDHDSLVFFFTSNKSSPLFEKCNQWAFDFDTVALRFKQFNINTVTFFYYDLFIQGMPSILNKSLMPGIVLFPAEKNSYNNKITYGKKDLNVQDLITFIQKHALSQFKVPKEAFDIDEFKEEL